MSEQQQVFEAPGAIRKPTSESSASLWPWGRAAPTAGQGGITSDLSLDEVLCSTLPASSRSKWPSEPAAFRSWVAYRYGEQERCANFTEALYAAREAAMEEMQSQISIDEGTGLVDAKIVDRPLPFADHVIEFMAYGTAIKMLAPAHTIPTFR